MEEVRLVQNKRAHVCPCIVLPIQNGAHRAVLTGANRSTPKDAVTRANAPALNRIKRLQSRRKTPMFAKGEHQFCGLDKLGVTGSSPVPPIESPWK